MYKKEKCNFIPNFAIFSQYFCPYSQIMPLFFLILGYIVAFILFSLFIDIFPITNFNSYLSIFQAIFLSISYFTLQAIFLPITHFNQTTKVYPQFKPYCCLYYFNFIYLYFRPYFCLYPILTYFISSIFSAIFRKNSSIYDPLTYNLLLYNMIFIICITSMISIIFYYHCIKALYLLHLNTFRYTNL